MDAQQFLERYPQEVPSVCEAAGTKPIYLRQLATGFRRPSPRMAKRLAEASGGRMDVLSLLYPEQQTVDNNA